MFCGECSTGTVSGANFCHYCGIQLSERGVVEHDEAFEVKPSRSGLRSDDDFCGNDDPHDMGYVGAKLESEMAPVTSEKDLWSGGFALRSQCFRFCVVILMSLACLLSATIALYRGNSSSTLFISLTFLIILAVQLFLVARRSLSVKYRLTDRRLFIRTGLLSHKKVQLVRSRVEDIRIHQTLLDRMVDVGAIEILSTHRHLGHIVLDGIHRPDLVAEMISSGKSDSLATTFHATGSPN